MVVKSLVRRTWSARAWWATAHVVLGAPIGLLTAVVMIVLAALTVTLTFPFLLAAVALVQLLIFNETFTSWQRSRFAALLGVDIPPLPRRDRPVWRWALAEARTSSTWRQFGYHVTAGVFGPVAAVVVVGTWSVGLLSTGSFVLAERLPGLLPDGGAGLLARAGLTAGGVVLLFAAPWLARALATADTTLARRLLGPSRRDELALRANHPRRHQDRPQPVDADAVRVVHRSRATVSRSATSLVRGRWA